MIGMKINKLFAFKSMMKAYSFYTLVVIFVSCVGSIGFMFMIAESPVFNVNAASRASNNSFVYIENCFWAVIITMTTVGYGDYFPKTLLGRIIAISTAFIGTIFTSLIINAVQEGINLTPLEAQIVAFYSRLEDRRHMEESSARYFLSTFRLRVAEKKYIKALENYQNCRRSNLSTYELNQENKKTNKLRLKLKDALYANIQDKKEFKNAVQFIFKQLFQKSARPVHEFRHNKEEIKVYRSKIN